jgi:diamine N-acetyltransferase
MDANKIKELTGANMDIIFESENINYVRPSMDLVPDYLEMVNDIDNVAKFIGERREPYTEEEERDYIKDKMDKDATMFSMLEKETGTFIGNIEFFNRTEDSAEWGIVLTSKMQNKGYGTEALKRSIKYGFNELGLSRIVLVVYTKNPRAIHVYEQCGFKEYDRNDVDIFMEIKK